MQKQIDDAFHRQVWLKCGGYIVIDETEALVAIDVNTGRNKGGRDVEKTILQTNLEAADEIARQLRLRNIGGLIIGDFIDMKSRKDQQTVYTRMKDRLKRDKAKTHVLPISPLGLMEMTRQRAQESLSDSIYETCPYCQGRGKVKTSMTMSVELHRTLNTVMRKYQDTVHDIRVILNPDVLEAPEGGRRGIARRVRAPIRRPAHVPRRPDLSPREIHHHRRQYRGGAKALIASAAVPVSAGTGLVLACGIRPRPLVKMRRSLGLTLFGRLARNVLCEALNPNLHSFVRLLRPVSRRSRTIFWEGNEAGRSTSLRRMVLGYGMEPECLGHVRVHRHGLGPEHGA